MINLEKDSLLVHKCLSDWISRQPWSNGSVGMFGKSWGGFNGLQVAFCQPQALKAVISIYSTGEKERKYNEKEIGLARALMDKQILATKNNESMFTITHTVMYLWFFEIVDVLQFFIDNNFNCLKMSQCINTYFFPEIRSVHN